MDFLSNRPGKKFQPRFDPAIGVRLKQIIDARKEIVRVFSENLLRETGHSLSEAELSKRITGKGGGVTMADAPHIAAMDPEGRGVHWLLYGTKEDPTLIRDETPTSERRPQKRATAPIVERDVTHRPSRRRQGER